MFDEADPEYTDYLLGLYLLRIHFLNATVLLTYKIWISCIHSKHDAFQFRPFAVQNRS